MEPNRLSIKKWAEQDRPREKLLLKGKGALSDAELLAILIGSGNRNQTAVGLMQHVLSQCQNDLSILARLSIKDLQKFNGIGEAKAIAIMAALELGRRRTHEKSQQQPKISCSTDAFALLKEHFQDLPHEEFWIIFLKRNNGVIRKEMISKGGIAGTVVDAKVIFKRALEETASGIILAHNHPSGNLKPSHEDLQLTKQLQQAGTSLDINVLDHLIVTDQTFLSLADEGLM